jgi:hypothetical protein
MSAMLSPPGATTTTAPTIPIATQGNQLLNTKSAGPWGKKVDPVVVQSTPTPITVPAVAAQTVRSPSPVVAPDPASTSYSAPAPPRQPTEREKMAAALFGGVGAAKPAAAPKKKAPVTAPSSTTPSASSLLDISDAPAQPAPTPSSSSNQVSMLYFLLSLPIIQKYIQYLVTSRCQRFHPVCFRFVVDRNLNSRYAIGGSNAYSGCTFSCSGSVVAWLLGPAETYTFVSRASQHDEPDDDCWFASEHCIYACLR